jgi:hypothetical protein
MFCYNIVQILSRLCFSEKVPTKILSNLTVTLVESPHCLGFKYLTEILCWDCDRERISIVVLNCSSANKKNLHRAGWRKKKVNKEKKIEILIACARRLRCSWLDGADWRPPAPGQSCLRGAPSSTPGYLESKKATIATAQSAAPRPWRQRFRCVEPERVGRTRGGGGTDGRFEAVGWDPPDPWRPRTRPMLLLRLRQASRQRHTLTPLSSLVSSSLGGGGDGVVAAL